MFSVVRTLEWPINSATIFSGTPLSCAQEQYVRRNVSHVVCGSFKPSQAGNTQRKMLFGEIGFPDRVQKIWDQTFRKIPAGLQTDCAPPRFLPSVIQASTLLGATD